MNINILDKMNKVPGGLIIIPLLVAILINTFAPQVLSIGGPTTALFKVGSSAMMGIFLLICGTSINIRQAGLPLYKGAVLLFLKCLAGALAVCGGGKRPGHPCQRPEPGGIPGRTEGPVTFANKTFRALARRRRN